MLQGFADLWILLLVESVACESVAKVMHRGNLISSQSQQVPWQKEVAVVAGGTWRICPDE